MKVTNSIALAGALIGLTNANPVVKRALSDADILNYALTLEHLEASFYKEGLKNYTQADFISAGFADPFYANLQEVASDEVDHVDFLTKALSAAGASPVAACTYDFPSVDVKSFLAVASVLEGVGVSAYLGAAASITNGAYLTAAGSILTVEARHSAYLRAATGESPYPQAFDNPLDPNEVYTVASPFIISCPSSNGVLPVKAFPSITLTSNGTIVDGSKVQVVTGSGFDASNVTSLSAAFITVTGPVFTSLKSNGGGKFTVTVPSGISGQSYLVFTKSNTTATDDTIVAGPAIIEVGKKWNISMSTSSNASATASSLSSPIFTGASIQMTGSVVAVLGAALFSAAIIF
ncbi:hypothetical protein N7495_007545 [Penicillium taxi]|uniref:uncharacterized protein n=1 Tax=Penicillium taxi TaxID=168475 RepID=UPI002544FDD7|nr:uncharacterized protein N7495_007545 [Penicillium taxi]KAJ5887504.1 hypothetical protein N7495_007545 [Penicillium taxi]